MRETWWREAEKSTGRCHSIGVHRAFNAQISCRGPDGVDEACSPGSTCNPRFVDQATSPLRVWSSTVVRSIIYDPSLRPIKADTRGGKPDKAAISETYAGNFI